MKCIVYNESYKPLLEEYFKHPNTPINNASHKMFKTHLYDGTKGILGLLIDNDEIVGVSSAIVIEEKGIKSIKSPHRLHVREDYSYMSNTFVNKYWDPLFANWFRSLPIDNVYCAFNTDNYLSFMWSAVKHKRRLKNNYVEDSANTFITGKWFAYDKLVMEMGCLQYICYSSPQDEWFYPWREVRNLDDALVKELNSRFPFFPGKGWLLSPP